MTEASLNSGDVTQLAALDLGSNSFHLIVAQETNGRLQVIDKIKEMVRLANGLDENNELTGPATDKALACLERFGQRLNSLQRRNVRVVGTNTLRRARNAATFIDRAEQALGHPVEIISGREEARLIYLGVSHSIEDNYERRLVIDIGGGSTELILGRHFEAEKTESLHMGCVGISRQFFNDGRIRAGQFRAAINHARQELVPVAGTFGRKSRDTVIGASGTILAAQAVLSEMDGSREITLDGLERVQEALIDAGHVDKLALPGLPTERAPVFPGGLAVLIAAFKQLDIECMEATSGALREGLLYDLLGRVHHQDVRENSVRDLCMRYHIDQTHARRVREMALALLAQVALDWDLTEPGHQLLLGWAADLHEIGMDIAHSQYHKHGGYLLANMDLPGFSKSDQLELAALVRAHRRKFPLEDGDYPPHALKLAVLLRLAVLLHRNRANTALPHVALRVAGDKPLLKFPRGWLKRHPLTRLDLNQEAEYLSAVGVELGVDEDENATRSVAG